MESSLRSRGETTATERPLRRREVHPSTETSVGRVACLAVDTAFCDIRTLDVPYGVKFSRGHTEIVRFLITTTCALDRCSSSPPSDMDEMSIVSPFNARRFHRALVADGTRSIGRSRLYCL